MQSPVVLFDCDGVLCPPWSFAEILTSRYGITPEITAPFFRGPFLAALNGEQDIFDILPSYLPEWGWKNTVTEFVELWLSAERHTIPEVTAIVNEVTSKGVRCGLATNQEKHRAKYMRTYMGFEQLFAPDTLFISSELGATKPNHGYYRRVTELLKVAAEQVLFIDDSPSHIDGAARFGWQAVLFTSADELRKELISRNIL